MKYFIALLLAVTTATAHAQFRTGNKLLSEMNGNSQDQMFALGYVAGVADAMNRVVYCAPAGITIGQVSDLTKQFLIGATERRHNPADLLMVDVLSRTWPCSKKGTGA